MGAGFTWESSRIEGFIGSRKRHLFGDDLACNVLDEAMEEHRINLIFLSWLDSLANGGRECTMRLHDMEVGRLAEMENKSGSPCLDQAQSASAAALADLSDRCVWPHQTPALRWLREDFVERLTAQLPGVAKGQWHLRLAGAALGKRSQFLASVEEETCCYALGSPLADLGGQTEPRAQGNWIEITPSIAFPILNCLLGGSSDDRFIPRRPLTSIERRLLLRVAQEALACLAQSWPDHRLTTLVVREEEGTGYRVQGTGYWTAKGTRDLGPGIRGGLEAH